MVVPFEAYELPRDINAGLFIPASSWPARRVKAAMPSDDMEEVSSSASKVVTFYMCPINMVF